MRWIIRSVFAILLLVVLAAGAVFMIPAEKIAGVAVARFNALTGRVLVIEGAVRPSIWPQLGVKIGAVSISNADWSDAGPMLQAEGLAISLDLQALVSGEVKITAVEALRPRIILERSATGEENWVFGGSSGGTVSTDTPGVGQPFTLGRGLIDGGTLVFIDHGAGSRIELSDISADVTIPDYRGEAAIDLQAMLRGQAVAVQAKVGAFQPFLDGEVVPVDLVLQAGAATISFAGRAGFAPMVAEGALEAGLGDLAAVAALAGIAPPQLPEGLGAREVAVSGALTVTEAASLHLRGGKIGLDGNQFEGDIDLLTAGERPKLVAQLRAGEVALASVAAAGGGAGGDAGGAVAGGWSTAAIDVSGLRAMDAAVGLSVQALDLGVAKLGPSQLEVTIDRGRAVFDIRKIAAYQGAISGQFVVNGRKGLSVGGDLNFAGLALEPLLREFGGYERLVGTGDLAIRFLGSGGNMAAIMQSLEGSGQLAFTKGEIRGLDVAGMLRTLDTGYVGEGQKTIFDAVTASFAIADGVLRNDDLLLQAPYLTAKGAGEVGIGARTIEYRLKATALAGTAGEDGITAPLLISGTWVNPKFSLDLESLAQEKLDAEKVKLEAKARLRAKELEAEAKARLVEKLGIELQDGQSLEDAARRRAEEALQEEAQRALEGLLGGN